LKGSFLRPPESGGGLPLDSNTRPLRPHGKLPRGSGKYLGPLGSDSDMVPLVASFHDAWADMVVPITGPVDGTGAFLADNEVPYLGILRAHYEWILCLWTS
jgi:hypothetical protein